MDRRAFIVTTGAAIATSALSGCVLLESIDAVEIGDIVVENHHTEPQTVHLRLTDGGESVDERTIDVEAALPDRPKRVELTGLPTESGTYVLHAWRQTQQEQQATTSDLTMGDHTCADVLVAIGRDGGTAVDVFTDQCRTPRVG